MFVLQSSTLRPTRLAVLVGVVLFTLGGTGLWTGCVKRPEVALIPQVQDAPEYFKKLRKSRQARKIYAKMDIRCYVQATYLSEELLRAYVKEYAQVYALDMAEQEALFAKEVASKEGQDTFLISLFAPRESWAQLGIEDDVWKVRAYYGPDGQQEKKLSSVQEISLEDAKRAYFYPQAQEQSRHFLVATEAPPGTTEVTLKMQSVVATETFSWRR